MELKPCDLILVRGQGFVSSSIEEITHSPYSHVCGYIGNNTLVEAEGFEKTGQVSISKYDSNDYDVYRCDGLTDNQKEGILRYITNQIGGHYDYFLLIIELFRYLFHLALPYKEPYKSNIYSSLWAMAYRSIGIDLCPNKYPSPADVSESKLLRKIN